MKKLFSAQNADVYLALAVAAIIGALIVPLPPWLLDALLALNLALAATLLVAALYAKNALKVAAFPTLLLLTTMFRLSLNVCSTRLALLEAHAGEVIQAFGEFVIQGEYVVGGVIFAILTLVQFLVVAKGAERVAEVGARFTLDAMPGKQMAIDADLRSGAIDQETARARRRALERESQLYGAMDGAMKFVKGDAIAGLIIVLINAIGGLIIGVLFKGMNAGEAARLYTLLAIGDGLVSQIPALCIAISAGLVVTRVASEDERSSLGADIASQFISQPKALAIVSGLLVLLGLMPMMPKLPFFGLAAAAALGSRWLARSKTRSEERARQAALERPGSAASAPKTEAPAPAAPTSSTAVGVAPICLDLDPSLEPLARAEQNKLISKELPALREMLYQETGVRFPGVRARGGASLGAGGYALLIDEVPCGQGRIEPAAFYAFVPPDELAGLGISAEPWQDPASGHMCAKIPTEAVDGVRELGVQVRSASEAMLLHIASVLRRQASTFLGIQEVQSLLDALEKTHPALVREASQKVTTPLLAEVLRRLIEEGVCIRNLRAILEALCEPGSDGDSLALSERCRRALRRHLSHRFAGDGTLYAHLADPELEEMLREAIRSAPEPGAIALAPDDAAAILDGVKGAFGDGSEGVILASPDVRRYLRKLCEGSFPNVAVLTYTELTPELQIRPVGKVSALRQAA